MDEFAQRYGPWGVVVGASEGLGAAFGEALARRGLNVLAIARREAELQQQTTAWARRHGVETRGIVMDMAGADAAAKLQRALASVDVGVAIYNAAYAPLGDLRDQPLGDLLKAVDVNVRGPLTLAHACSTLMHERARGGVVLMSSLAGDQGSPRLATYAATKAFNTILSEALWHELRPLGVDVVVSCAGAIRTPGYNKTRQREAPGTLDAAAVATQTLDALGRGPRVVPGFTNRLASAIMRRLPRSLAVGIMARSTRDLS